MSTVVVAPILVALGTAVATLLTRTNDALTRAVSLLGGVGYLAAVAVLFQRVVLPLGSEGRTLVYQMSDWQAPFGIVLVADPLSAFMVGFGALVSLCAIAYSVLYVDSYGQRLTYHPLYHFMVVGITGSFLTGDIFNLFVWFEVMLMSTYVLVLFYSGSEHTRAAMNYVVLNLLASAVMLLAIGGLYATTGTLNMADLARRLADPATYDVAVAPVLGLSALLFSVFTIKAGLVPFQFWVPAAYRAAPAPVTAMMAGVVKKVGVYAIVRLYFTVFAAASLPVSLPFVSGDSVLAFFGPVLFLMAAASIVVGGVGAIGREDLDGLLAYSSISQVGFIVLPLAVAATADSTAIRTLGVAAALVYAFNHALAKSLLFLATGTIREAVGTDRFGRLGGLAGRAPVLSAAFLVGALTLVGVPPLSGFFGKLLVFRTAADAFAGDVVGAGAAIVLALVGAVLTIAYYTRAWNDAFWGRPGSAVEAALPSRWSGPAEAEADEGTVADGGGESPDGQRTPPDGRSEVGGRTDGPPTSLTLTGEVVVVAALAVAAVAFGLGFEAVYAAAIAAAEAALGSQEYVDAVLGSAAALWGVVA